MAAANEGCGEVEQPRIICVNGNGKCGERDQAALVLTGVSSQNNSSSSLLQMIAAVEVLVKGIGEDVEREGLLKTPLRVASAFQSSIAGYQHSAKEIVGEALFSEVGTIDETVGSGGAPTRIVVVRNIDVFSLCESCLLPFRIRCHVVYIPSGHHVVGLSKPARVVDIFAKRLQNPKKFADEVVEALNESVRPLGVGVVVESWHLQWPDRCESNLVALGSNAEEWSRLGWVPKVVVYSGKGRFENLHCSLWDEALIILQLEDVNIENPTLGEEEQLQGQKVCPFLVYDGQEYASLGDMTMSTVSASAAAIVVGLESLLHAAGGKPSKEQILSAASRFVNWIISATQGSRGCGILNGLVNPGSQVLRYGNGLLRDNNGTLNNGSSLLKLEVMSGVQSHTEGHVCSEWDMPFSSLCEHHLLPFFGIVHVSYVLGEERCFINRSVVAKIVRKYSRRLQMQERVTRQISEAVFSLAGLQGVMVVAEASHMCIMSRGVEKLGSTTITVATIGKFSSDGAMRAGFLKRISMRSASRRHLCE